MSNCGSAFLAHFIHCRLPCRLTGIIHTRSFPPCKTISSFRQTCFGPFHTGGRRHGFLQKRFPGIRFFPWKDFLLRNLIIQFPAGRFFFVRQRRVKNRTARLTRRLDGYMYG